MYLWGNIKKKINASNRDKKSSFNKKETKCLKVHPPHVSPVRAPNSHRGHQLQANSNGYFHVLILKSSKH